MTEGTTYTTVGICKLKVLENFRSAERRRDGLYVAKREKRAESGNGLKWPRISHKKTYGNKSIFDY